MRDPHPEHKITEIRQFGDGKNIAGNRDTIESTHVKILLKLISMHITHFSQIYYKALMV